LYYFVTKEPTIHLFKSGEVVTKRLLYTRISSNEEKSSRQEIYRRWQCGNS